MAAPPKDPNLEALDPMLRDLRKAQVRETMQDASRVLLGQTRPPPKDYTDQRIKLIGMLGQLSQMETDLRAEREKTGRVRLSTQATIVATLGRLMGENTKALSEQNVARINALDTEMRAVERQIEERGNRTAADLPDAAAQSVKAAGRYVVNGVVPSGNAAAFALELAKGVMAAKGAGADAALPMAYLDEVTKQYGMVGEGKVSALDFLTKPGPVAVPAEAQKILPMVSAARLQAEKNAEVQADLEARGDEAFKEMSKLYGLSDAGGALARNVLGFEQVTGRSAMDGETTATIQPPAATAKPAEKQAFFDKMLGAGVAEVSADGVNVTLAQPDGTKTAPITYASAVAPIKSGGGVSGMKVTSYIDARMDHVLKELDRLETGTDPDSVRDRKMILASPELATWARENGYEDFSPELQLKALLPAVRKMRQEERAAFRAKFDADMMAGKGGALGKAVASVRDFLRPEDKKVGPGARRSREDSADLTGGATTPAGKTDNTGATEAEPKKWSEEMDAPRADGLYPPVSMQRLDVEGARAEAEAEAEAKAKKMAAESAARPERTLPADTAFGDALARGRNERTVQRTLSNADPTKFGDIAKQYEAIQSFKSTDPRAYATALAGLAREVNRRGTPRELTAEGGGAETGTMAEGRLPIKGMGTAGFAMEEGPALEEARRQYREAQTTGEQPRAIPQGRRGTLIGPSMVDVAAINATLPPIDETDVPEPPTEGAIEEGTDTLPPPPAGTMLAEAEPETSPVAAAEVASAGDSAVADQKRSDRASRIKSLLAEGTEPAAQAAGDGTGGTGGGGAMAKAPTATTPSFQSFGAEAATQAAGQTMANYLSAEEQLRARRRAALGLGPAQA